MNKLTHGLLSIVIIAFVISCATGNEAKYEESGGLKTIPLPPQRLNESKVPPAVLNAPANSKQHASGVSKQTITNSNNQDPNAQPSQRIQEDRSNGEVTQIKVNNNRLPDYYIYPSQQPDSNGRNTTDTSISTPSWQISW